MDQPTIFILPGWQDSGPRHWQSIWLAKYPQAIKVVQNDWMYPEKKQWVETFHEYIEKYNSKDIILVGHSLACAVIAHWSDEYFSHTHANITGALLVSPIDMDAPNFPKEIQGFSPICLEKLKFRSIVVASESDTWSNIQRTNYFAQCWGAEMINIGKQGHINVDAGFGEWPQGEKILQELMEPHGLEMLQNHMLLDELQYVDSGADIK